MAPSKSSRMKAAWDRAKRYAVQHNVTVKEARTILAGDRGTAKSTRHRAEKRPAKANPSKLGAVGLAAAERELRKKYPHIIEGSLSADHAGPVKGRRTVTIRCQAKGCTNTRQINTSDAFQVKFCTECTKARRRHARKSAAAK